MALIAEGSVVVGSAVQCALFRAIFTASTSGLPPDRFKLDLPIFIEQFMLGFANII